MKQKTIEDAVKMLPPQYRKQIIRLWKVTRCMDLYDGELTQYLDVIAQRMEYLDERLNKNTDALKELKARISGFLEDYLR